MPRSPKVATLLFANMILYVNLNNFLKRILFTLWHLAYHIGILQMIVFFLLCKGNILLSILVASGMCLHLSMQGEDILENVNAKCHLCTL